MVMTPRVVDIYWREPLGRDDFQNMAKAGIWGVIHKSSEGSAFKDREYLKRKKTALALGLLWGGYHFANASNVRNQVDNFLDMTGEDDKTLLVLDWEDNPGGGKMSKAQAMDFLTQVYNRTGQRPALYGGNTIKEALARATKDELKFFGQHRLWLCQYGSRAVLPPGWGNYWLWQYTGDGLGQPPHDLPHVTLKNMDLNTFNGSREELTKQWAPGYTAKPQEDTVASGAKEALPPVPGNAGNTKSWWSRIFGW